MRINAVLMLSFCDSGYRSLAVFAFLNFYRLKEAGNEAHRYIIDWLKKLFHIRWEKVTMEKRSQETEDVGGIKDIKNTCALTELTWRSRIKRSGKMTRKTRASFPVWRKKKRRQTVP